MSAAPVLTEAPALTADQRRSRRHRAVRARTESVKRLPMRDLEAGRVEHPEDALTDALRAERPRTRGECQDGLRPCPWVSCRHHLALDVDARTGAIKRRFPDLEVDEMRESCSLDVADRDGITLEEVGAVLNLTRERIRQLEVHAMGQVKRHLPMLLDREDIE